MSDLVVELHLVSGQLAETHEVKEFSQPNDSHVLFLDQAEHTGISLFNDQGDLKLYGMISKQEGMQAINFMPRLIELVKKLIANFNVHTLVYEETYNLRNMKTTEVLAYFKYRLRELENDDLSVYGITPAQWRGALLKGEDIKFPKKRKEQKVLVTHLMQELYPKLTFTTDDETDSLGMGVALTVKNDASRIWSLVSYQKHLPINVKVIKGKLAEDDVAGLKLPKSLSLAREQGIKYLKLPSKTGDILDFYRMYLTHHDYLLVVNMDLKYSYWGVYLLLNNIEIDDSFGEDYTMLIARKSRLLTSNIPK